MRVLNHLNTTTNPNIKISFGKRRATFHVNSYLFAISNSCKTFVNQFFLQSHTATFVNDMKLKSSHLSWHYLWCFCFHIFPQNLKHIKKTTKAIFCNCSNWKFNKKQVSRIKKKLHRMMSLFWKQVNINSSLRMI